jgi:RimJ/RimL family protein N-acetyltransferase
VAPHLLRTARLELAASTSESAATENRSVGDLATLLAVPPPESWPPPLNDDASQQWNLDMLRRDPDAVGWGMWYIVAVAPHRVLVGNIGFKGRPSQGSCEIGYSVLPQFQSRGYATEAARALIAWAFSHSDVERVSAETLPELAASIRVMEKCGMHFVGDGKPEEGLRTIRYAALRPVNS